MRRYRVTLLLISLNVAIYAYLAFLSGNLFEIGGYWTSRYGFEKTSFFAGAWWQLMTSMFIHFSISHLGYNMVFLAFFGSRAEELFGEKEALLSYLFLGVFATLVSFVYPLGTVSAGASGAIFGILGMDLIAQRGEYVGGVSTSLTYGLVFFILAAATGFLAHLLGLIAGFVAGYWVSRDWYPEEEAEGELQEPF